MPAPTASWLAPKARTEEHWIPLSDLMTGLMMIFMLISVVSMAQLEASRNSIRAVARQYSASRQALHDRLQQEFAADLPRWRATLTPDLGIRFDQPDVLFATGQSTLKDGFKRILDNFFPRYIGIIADPRFRAGITEIRIEGHTSSTWNGAASADDAYFRNMELSQGRTRSTLAYVLLLPGVAAQKPWLAQRLTANGLSSSRPVRNPDGTENAAASQRVEFKIRTDAEAKIEEISSQGLSKPGTP
jgi:outer membrane protein OmpA-like peptidoglycan-associated protein